MRIESIPDSSASPSTGNAIEQRAAFRTAPARTDPGRVDSVPAVAMPVDPVELYGAAPTVTVEQQIEFTAPKKLAMPANSGGPIDRNGDGLIDLADVPIDYFQISRQASRKLITLPSTEPPL